MAQKNIDPSFLLGQLVATAQCLYPLMESIQTNQPSQETTEKVQKMAPMELFLSEIAPYEESLHNMEKGDLLQDMKEIYQLKVDYDFIDEPLDQAAYDAGYTMQMEKHGTNE